MAGEGEDKLTEDSSEAETSTEDDEELNNQENSVLNNSDSGKRKKKKKKKKKKPALESESAIGSDDSSSQNSQADKQETERRFAKALESAKQSEDMWVLLSNASIHDAKARKLFEALRDNSSITSVNLSANHIGDDGVRALTEVLSAGGCSELINLDLRGNSLSEEAQQLLAGLHKKRKQLVIETGPMPDESAVAVAESSSGSSSKPRGRVAAARAAKAAAEQTQQQHDDQRAGQTLRELAKHNPMFRKYFQTEEEDGPGSSGDEEVDQVDELPDPEEVWADISELLPQGQVAVPELSQKLLAVTHALEVEMSSMPSFEDNAQLHDFRPHFQAVVKKLELLQQVLQLTPQPQLNQFSSDKPQPAVGSHRVWACAILHMLLLHNNLVIDEAVRKAGLLPTAIALALQHQRCSALQCRAVEMLRCCLCSSVRGLWQGLFKEGYDHGLQQSGQLMPPLHESLMQLASSAVKQPVGVRSPVMGFVSEVANTLLQSCDTSNTDSYCSQLAELLNGCEEWQGSIEPQGAIHTLLQEQDGQLCGPPPPRPVQSIDEEDIDGQNLNIIKGSQLMQLLSRMAELDTAER